MALVNYSDSGSSDDDQSQTTDARAGAGSKCAPHSLKRKPNDVLDTSLPPLPESFHDLYPTAKRRSNQDDPSLHSGRQRLIPHVEGNWPSHIYIECKPHFMPFSEGYLNSYGWQSGGHPQKEETERLLKLLADINHGSQSTTPVHSLIRSELGENLPLHISLSRPINLATHQRQAFTDRLISDMSRFNVRPYVIFSRLPIFFTQNWRWAGSFDVSTNELDWVSNNEKSRWFLVMRIKKPPNNELNRLLQSANDAVTAFGQPPLYAQPESQPSVPTQGFATKARHSRHSKPKFLLKKAPIFSPNPIIDQSSNFHISIGWYLGCPLAEISSATPPIHQLDTQNLPEFHFEVKSIKLKIGNSVTSISLLSKMETSSGIF